jgi:tRNA pseudouridine55 synthase
MNKENFDGIYAFWKPRGISSNGFLNLIRRACGIRKVGHSGTLDPLAEGVLVVGMGKGTKKLTKQKSAEKEYEAVVRLGVSSSTDDEEGEKREHYFSRKPEKKEIIDALNSFRGIIDQIPPVYSAIKVQGKEAYKRVRKGENIKMEARKAEIKDIKLLSYEWPFVCFKVITGPGVYIRSIARDIGERLGTGGYLSSLKRVRVAEFSKDKLISIDDLCG